MLYSAPCPLQVAGAQWYPGYRPCPVGTAIMTRGHLLSMEYLNMNAIGHDDVRVSPECVNAIDIHLKNASQQQQVNSMPLGKQAGRASTCMHLHAHAVFNTQA